MFKPNPKWADLKAQQGSPAHCLPKFSPVFHMSNAMVNLTKVGLQHGACTDAWRTKEKAWIHVTRPLVGRFLFYYQNMNNMLIEHFLVLYNFSFFFLEYCTRKTLIVE